MKILAEIPHAQLRITLFAWNQKYILKFEQGALEQSYKISELDVTGEAEVLEIAQDEAFWKSNSTLCSHAPRLAGLVLRPKLTFSKPLRLLAASRQSRHLADSVRPTSGYPQWPCPIVPKQCRLGRAGNRPVHRAH